MVVLAVAVIGAIGGVAVWKGLSAGDGKSMMFRGGPERTGVYPGPPVEGPPVVRWTFPTDDWVSSSPAVVDGTVYVGSLDGNLYAVDTTSGQQIWRYATDNQISSPAVVNGVAYVGSLDDNLYAVESAGSG